MGSKNVGKTSLITRIEKNKFLEEHNETMSPSISEVTRTIKDMKKTFELVDPSGDEKYRQLNRNYYNRADIVLLVYDITVKQSLSGVISIYESFESCFKEHTVFVIANKIDLIDQQEDIEQEGREYAKSINAFFISISCSTGEGIEDIFDSIVIDKKKVAHSGIRLDDSESRQKKTKCCK